MLLALSPYLEFYKGVKKVLKPLALCVYIDAVFMIGVICLQLYI